MSNELTEKGLAGRKIAFLVANSGVEQVELTAPWQAVESAGGSAVLVSPEIGTVQAFDHDVEKAETFQATERVRDAEVDDFVGLVLPGGTTNPDTLRTVPEAVAFVRRFFDAGKPVAAICHGPWTLVEADVLRDKTLTSWPSLQTDIRNAGGQWRDEQVFTCTAAGWTLVTSRKPDDLDAFCDATITAFAAADMSLPAD